MRLMCINDSVKRFTKFKEYVVESMINYGTRGKAYQVSDDTGSMVCIDIETVTVSTVCVKGMSTANLLFVTNTISQTGKKFMKIKDSEMDIQSLLNDMGRYSVTPFKPTLYKYRVHFTTKPPLTIECDLTKEQILYSMNRRYMDYVILGKHVMKRDIVTDIEEIGEVN